MTHANRPQESPSRLSAVVNARHLEEIPERDLSRLAELLEEAAVAYLAAAAAANETAAIPTPNGLVISPATMTVCCLANKPSTASTFRVRSRPDGISARATR